MDNLYRNYCKPLTGDLFSLLKLDKTYTRAEDNSMFYENELGEEVEVVDFVGGYGSGILGHNNKDIISEYQSVLSERLPFNAQLSIRNQAGKLAQKLNELIPGDYIVNLSNSGAEAVEIAIKHALLEKNVAIDSFLKYFEKQARVFLSGYYKSNKRIELKFGQNIVNTPEEYISLIRNKNFKLMQENQPIFFALEKAFHGKTMGALSLTYREAFRIPFWGDAETTVFVSQNIDEFKQELRKLHFKMYVPKLTPGDIAIIEAKEFHALAGFFIEPVQGEGGVNFVSEDFLKEVNSLATEYNFPLIIDEIQSGFYRTGKFLASDDYSFLNRDYILLGKSLGGGITKIAACLISKKRYNPKFGLIHTSTFAEDDHSAAIALKSIELADRNTVKAFEASKYLASKLFELHSKYPRIIKQVRGKGLMYGLEFESFNYSESYALQVLSRSGYLGYIAAAYILNNYNIRLSATLSSDFTVRIQPSLFIDAESIDKLYDAVCGFCDVLENRDIYKLLSFLLDKEYRNLRPMKKFKDEGVFLEENSEIIETAAFLTHYSDVKGIIAGDDSLSCLPGFVLENFFEELLSVAYPALLSSKIITNVEGKKIRMVFIGLPFTAKMAYGAIMKGETSDYIRICNKAIEFVQKEFNAKYVGLGQYTSIIMKNGSEVNVNDVHVTTGNSYTVYMALQAVFKALKNKKQKLENLKIGIVGAGGNISSVYTECISKYTTDITLFGRPTKTGIQNVKRTERTIYANALTEIESGKAKSLLAEQILNNISQELVSEIPKIKNRADLSDYLKANYTGKLPVKTAESYNELRECDVVVIATNSPEPFVSADMIKDGAVVCDISVPVNCTKDLVENKKNIDIVLGGIVKLPGEESLNIKGFPLDKGEAFACISETMLCAFAKIPYDFSFGNILQSRVNKIGKIGDENGFALGSFKKEF